MFTRPSPRSARPLRRTRAFTMLSITGAAVALVGSAAAAVGGTSTTNNATYTACLSSVGTLYNVVRSPNAPKSCSTGATRVSWNESGVAGPSGVAGVPGPTGATGPAGPGQATFLQDGQYTVPAGVTSVTAELRGGGGGSGFFLTSSGAGQGGFVRTVIPATPGDVWAIAVGSGGRNNRAYVSAYDGGISSVVIGGVKVAYAAGGTGGSGFDGTAPQPGGSEGIISPASAIEETDGAPGAFGGAPNEGGGKAGVLGSGAASGSLGSGVGGYVILTPNV